MGVGQTRSTVDDATAAAVARQAAATLSQVMTQANTAEWDDGKFHAFPESNTPTPGALHLAVIGAQICTADPRYAWIPLYRRETGSSLAQLLIVVVRSDARPQFTIDDLKTFDPIFPPTLQPGVATAYSVRIEGNELQLTSPSGLERIGPGTLIVLNSGDANINGRVVRVSARGDNGRWQLAPGQDLADLIEAHAREAALNPLIDPAFNPQVENAFIVGRGYADVRQPAKGYAGASQAIAAYSTMITLR